VEEQFYLIWPWLVLFLSTKWLQPVLVSLVVLSFCIKSFSGIEGVRLLTFSHFDTLGAGALMALNGTVVSRVVRIMQRHTMLLIASSVGMLVVYAWVYQLDALKFGAQLLLTSSLVVGSIQGFRGDFGKLLDMHWLGHAGRISYGLYLYHKPIPLLLKLTLAELGWSFPGWSLLAFSLALTIVIAELSFRFLEAPFLRLKERFDL
jgi:peptidoglycan/LPS O-acetylase OafA/YrhL